MAGLMLAADKIIYADPAALSTTRLGRALLAAANTAALASAAGLGDATRVLTLAV
jgi:hypothetical protein